MVKQVAVALAASGILVGCGLGDEAASVYYVPVPEPMASSQDGIPAIPNSGDTDSAKPVPPARVSPDWETTCQKIADFKASFTISFSLSPSDLIAAAKASPNRETKRDMRFLGRELEKSQEAFSMALLSEVGARVDAEVLTRCGEPLLNPYRLDEATDTGPQ